MLPRLAVASLLVVLLGSAAPKDDAALAETLVKQEKKLIDALQKKDTATLKSMFVDESMAITAYGGRITGEEQLKVLADLELTSYTLTNAKVVAITKDVAILSYVFRMKGKFKGKELPGQPVYATSVWALRDGQWRSMFYQETPIEFMP